MLSANLRRYFWLAALTAALAIAGCSSAQPGGGDTDGDGGDDGGNGGGGGGGDLCSTLSEDEVAEITGADVTETEFVTDDCNFTVEETSLVNVRYESSFDQDLQTANIICDNGEDVSGVGDRALWCPDINVLYFNKGDRSLAVQLVFLMEEPPRPFKDIAVDLGREVADGL
jgi:hypothetical protein